MMLYIIITHPSHIIVIVTQLYITQKEKKGSEAIMLYNIFTTY